MYSSLYKKQKTIILFAFLLLPVTLLILFSLYPGANLLYLSLTSWDGYSSDKGWVGFDNYREIFRNSEIFSVFGHNLYYFFGGILQNVVALYFAVILSRKLRGRNGFRVLIFLPYIMNSVAIAYMFSYVYDAQHGSLNALLTNLGLGDLITSWLGNKHMVNISLALISMWKYLGFNMVIYIGALQSIPEDLYEAARIDGANGWQSFRFITWPSLLKIIELSMLLTVTGALEVFDLPFIMTKGGPAGASETFVTKTVDTAFHYSNYGLASAMGVVLLAIVIIVITVQRKLILREEKGR
ncbi:carbohydrate ABC transporter permease [Paenibacillus sacheonensis]|uniref:ABC transporter permease subunit n=1 Tax=Paenibacillus sacheonensis TaxID=742054 RepID=A0A7X5BYT1_9BACL|nr:sugar ABC transporter permease [Paenibacillus sacheonensis]MBM7565232.1 multiple sugar transport system permease protein [Paenibacillus sacheonensis]NBC69992.1 ABC transporter permease subunit [Paenibacillus sacheonensis]